MGGGKSKNNAKTKQGANIFIVDLVSTGDAFPKEAFRSCGKIHVKGRDAAIDIFTFACRSS